MKFLSFFLLLIVMTACQNTKTKSSNKVKSAPDSVAPVYSEDITIDYVMGKFSPEDDDRFSLIPEKYADRSGMYLRQEALDDFIRMYTAAKQEGIVLEIRSATRNFDYQKGIWERKWTGKTILSDGTNVSKDIDDPKQKALKILEYSSMPSTSRHHWGTDIDLNSFDNQWFAEGEGLDLYNWMTANAHKYGYCQPYTEKNDERPHGYEEEKWHWSYMPLAKVLTDFAEDNLNDDMIAGFMGSQEAKQIKVVDKFILGINKDCR